jgi:DNA-binding CsgD family transcriptional regulator
LINTSKQEFNKKIESSKEKELLFLKYAATDIPYKDIANKMLLSRHTIDDYRNSLYEKFAVKSRIGLVLLAKRFKIV